MTPLQFDYEENLGEGLRYTETIQQFHLQPNEYLRKVRLGDKRPTRFCRLWKEGVEEPVSYLTLVEFKQRFGAAILPVEGFGGVATPPQHRRKGYISQLMRKAIERASHRVHALFLIGIENLYVKYGFSCCWVKCELHVATRHAEAVIPLEGTQVREMTPDDFPAVCKLYNREHALRPCSVERDPQVYPGPRPAEDWNPGQTGIVLETPGHFLGYAVYTNESYGNRRPFTILELTGIDTKATSELVRLMAEIAIERRIETIVFEDAPDSLLGTVLRGVGCRVLLNYPHYGDGMGLICNRYDLVDVLAEELSRRAGKVDEAALERLAAGDFYPDAVLLPLLTGYLSWKDAAAMGYALPNHDIELVKHWFTGNSVVLPIPYMHHADHY